MIFNELADRGQLNQVLQRRFNMTGAAPAPALAPELFPTLVYENDRPEWGYLKNERYCAGRVTVPATVGTNATIYLAVPSSSDVIATLLYCEFSVSGATTVNILGYGDTFKNGIGGPIVGNSGALDERFPLNVNNGRNTGASVTGENLALYPAVRSTIFAFFNCGTTGTVEVRSFNGPYIIRPNSKMILSCATQNVGLSASFVWRERPAMPGEVG